MTSINGNIQGKRNPREDLFEEQATLGKKEEEK
jgi:hypothetical protein